MLPAYDEAALTVFEREEVASRDFALDYQNERINGIREELEEVRQAVYFILNTERYQYLIYPWSYGVELQNLIGGQWEYVIPEIERRIREALLQDDRILSADNFQFEKRKTMVSVVFDVCTILGDFSVEKVVSM